MEDESKDDFTIRGNLEDIRNFEAGITNYDDMLNMIAGNTRALDSEAKTRFIEAGEYEKRAIEYSQEPILKDLQKDNPWFEIAEMRRETIKLLLRSHASKGWVIEFLRIGMKKTRQLLDKQRLEFSKTERIKAEKDMWESFKDSKDRQLNEQRKMYADLILTSISRTEKKVNRLVETVNDRLNMKIEPFNESSVFKIKLRELEEQNEVLKKDNEKLKKIIGVENNESDVEDT